MISFVLSLQHDFSLNKLINNNIHTFHDCTKNGLFLLYEECGLRFQKKKMLNNVCLPRLTKILYFSQTHGIVEHNYKNKK